MHTTHVEKNTFFALKLSRLATRDVISNTHCRDQINVSYTPGLLLCTTGLGSVTPRPPCQYIWPPAIELTHGHCPLVVLSHRKSGYVGLKMCKLSRCNRTHLQLLQWNVALTTEDVQPISKTASGRCSDVKMTEKPQKARNGCCWLVL
jgi:hypothetical protein